MSDVQKNRGPLIPPLTKSWLFEIVDRETMIIEESFTLVMPPTGISIKEPQRVSITKTFGNAFIDDYGPDNIQITLKGFSGTAHAFPTFSPVGGVSKDLGAAFETISTGALNAGTHKQDGYTGKDAFYYFRDKIMRYKDRPGWDKRELRVYDLADEQAYRCVLLDFSLDRTADQPLRYPFTISLFVYQKLSNYKPKLKPVPIAKDPISSLNNVDGIMASLTARYKEYKTVMNTVANVSVRARVLRAKISKIAAEGRNILESPLDMAKSLIDAMFTGIGVIADTYKAGLMTIDRYARGTELMRSSLNDGLRIYGYYISEGWQEVKEISLSTGGGMDVSGGVSGIDPSPILIDWTYPINGLTPYLVKGLDTLQKIARDMLGDVDSWPVIASINPGITSNADLIPGTEIYIPSGSSISEEYNKESFIMTEDTIRNPYGVDIQLDQDGNMIIRETGDFALVGGVENVKQSVDLRINTLAGSMIKQSAFGIQARTGMAGTEMALRYVRMSLTAAVVQDPRIESVSNMQIQVGSDVLKASMDIKIIGQNKSIPVTAIM